MADNPATALPLADIHLPEPISFWPLAPGWWILLATLIMLTAAAVIVWRMRKRQRPQPQDNNDAALRQQLTQELDRAWQAFESTPDQPAPLLLSIQQTMKIRVRHHDAYVATLHGESWVAWLTYHHPDHFDDSSLALLKNALYRPLETSNKQQLQRLYEQTRTWLERPLTPVRPASGDAHDDA